MLTVFRQFGLQIGTFLRAADFIMRKLSLLSVESPPLSRLLAQCHGPDLP